MVILSLIVKRTRIKALVKDKRVALEAFGTYVEVGGLQFPLKFTPWNFMQLSLVQLTVPLFLSLCGLWIIDYDFVVAHVVISWRCEG